MPKPHFIRTTLQGHCGVSDINQEIMFSLWSYRNSNRSSAKVLYS